MDSESPSPAPIGRLAPSPTGLLHLGHARTFLLAWAQIRSRNGRVLLRVEDLDADRAKPELADALLVDLEWLGIDWDGAPVYQSRRLDLYRAALDTLTRGDHIYPCICTRRDVREAVAAPHPGQTEAPYPGTCRHRFPSLSAGASGAPKAASLRFRVPEESVRFVDGIAGAQRYDVWKECGDFVVARRDGAPAYQLAVVVDDAEQGVTEVLRGDDLLESTARQWLLQEALGLSHPSWFHTPLVVDADGHRLAKRSDALSLEALRRSGMDPRAIVAWVARSAGLDTPEHMTSRDLLRGFTLDHLHQRGPANAETLFAVKPQSVS